MDEAPAAESRGRWVASRRLDRSMNEKTGEALIANPARSAGVTPLRRDPHEPRASCGGTGVRVAFPLCKFVGRGTFRDSQDSIEPRRSVPERSQKRCFRLSLCRS